ncbi:Type 1 glutamine amidotransferase-like domain-containing protein [Alphaproteobacteria bacterium]|nr:Type 1 glutamine amidotransferase-like domain-containing protein [Alphaproteobacteria bacterium]
MWYFFASLPILASHQYENPCDERNSRCSEYDAWKAMGPCPSLPMNAQERLLKPDIVLPKTQQAARVNESQRSTIALVQGKSSLCSEYDVWEAMQFYSGAVYNGMGADPVLAECLYDAVFSVLEPPRKVVFFNEKTVVEALKKAKVLYFGGGNTGEMIKALGADVLAIIERSVRGEGKKIVGICGGALLFCKERCYDGYEEQNNGLDLLGRAEGPYYKTSLSEPVPRAVDFMSKVVFVEDGVDAEKATSQTVFRKDGTALSVGAPFFTNVKDDVRILGSFVGVDSEERPAVVERSFDSGGRVIAVAPHIEVGINDLCHHYYDPADSSGLLLSHSHYEALCKSERFRLSLFRDIIRRALHEVSWAPLK